MVREYRWQLKVRSYEGDAWGLLPASGMMRYLEESAVSAARDVGYGRDFHEERGSAWVIRRMNLALESTRPHPRRAGDRHLDIALRPGARRARVQGDQQRYGRECGYRPGRVGLP